MEERQREPRKEKRSGNMFKTFLKAGIILLLVSLTGLYYFQTSGRFQKSDEIKVAFEHDNLYEDSVAGIFEDIDKAVGLPDELYLVNHLDVTFYATGEIASVDTFFYGKDEDGRTQTYLVDFNRAKSSKMTVYTGNYAEADYSDDMRMMPLFTLLGKVNIEKMVDEWAEETKSHTFELKYAGKRSFTSADGLEVVADRGKDEADTSVLEQLAYGGEVSGFAVTVAAAEEEEQQTDTAGNKNEITYIEDPVYTSAAVLQQQNRREQVDKAKGAAEGTEGGDVTEAEVEETPWTENREDGSMYFFSDKEKGYRLLVTDAACGSRFYELESTVDGGKSWNQLNADPFCGNIGVAEGMEFYDDNLGVIGLSGASADASALYITMDGGRNFTQIELPVDAVTELPDTAAEYGFTVSDYDYYEMPEQAEGKLTIKAVSAKGETEGILFESADGGNTWNYSGISY